MERHFHEELEQFNANILKMAELTEQGLDKAFQALRDQNVPLAEEVIRADKVIDELELKVDELAVALLALNQPMAVDLRMITTGMHVNAAIERIADLVVNIAQRAIEVSREPLLKPLIDIEKMTHVAKRMVRGASDALIQRDIRLAKEVIMSDGESNALRDAVYDEVIHDHIVKDGSLAPRAVPLILVARDLERICDNAAAIAEDVIYMIQAKTVRHHPERLENGGLS
ncbi:MAG: phosphate signaling complex protein PhoU [Candidatus Omnitrophota bacterium]